MIVLRHQGFAMVLTKFVFAFEAFSDFVFLRTYELTQKEILCDKCTFLSMILFAFSVTSNDFFVTDVD